MRVDKLLVEEALPIIAGDLSLAITQDRATQRDVIILSTMGGIDIELVAHENPASIATVPIDPLLGLTDYAARDVLFGAGFDKSLINKAVPILKGLYKAYVATDATLAEINPLVIARPRDTGRRRRSGLIDDNALCRQHGRSLQLGGDAEEDPIEAEAHRKAVQYVRLEGLSSVLSATAQVS